MVHACSLGAVGQRQEGPWNILAYISLAKAVSPKCSRRGTGHCFAIICKGEVPLPSVSSRGSAGQLDFATYSQASSPRLSQPNGGYGQLYFSQGIELGATETPWDFTPRQSSLQWQPDPGF